MKSQTPNEESTLAAKHAHYRRAEWALLAGFPLLVVALFLQNITVTDGKYAKLLLKALALTAAADVLFLYALCRGKTMVRIAACVLLLPTLFVVRDFDRRLPSVIRELSKGR